jgi:hypothetical protein
MKRRLQIRFLTNPILTFALLFILGPIIPQMLLKKCKIWQKNVIIDITVPEWVVEVTELE